MVCCRLMPGSKNSIAHPRLQATGNDGGEKVLKGHGWEAEARNRSAIAAKVKGGSQWGGGFYSYRLIFFCYG